MLPTFLALSLSCGSPQKRIAERAQGKTIVHLHNSDLVDLSLLLPSQLEQQRIGSFFRELDKLIESVQKKAAKLRQVKSALLEEMFV